ncbi:MAG: DEAD/DEAH box helicase [Bacteroidia bacterium]
MPGFDRYELHPRVLDALPALGFRQPTAVQEQVIPRLIQKRNLIVEAPTGTGKTAAYGLPLISRLDLLKRHTQALVLVSSRELALQVSEALTSYFDGPHLRVGAVYGGVSMEESYETIRSAPHILVIVPGRLRDVSSHHRYDYLWRDIKFLIVDEGDKFVESGFLRDFDEIRSHVRKSVQVGFFSATIPPDAEEMMRERFPHIETLRISPRQTLRNIRFHRVEVQEGRREAYLVGLLEQRRVRQALIFAGGREDIYALVGFLRNYGLRAEAYYGNQDQQERTHILRRFQDKHIDYLIASDLAARGLDIEALPAVINLVVPETYDYYLHRVGRTGRAGLRGEVYNLVAGPREASYLRNHHEHLGLPVGDLPIEAADLDERQVQGDKWVKSHLSRGRRDKLRPGDIMGFLIHAAGLQPAEIGTITIHDSYSLVDLTQRTLNRLQADEELKIKGKGVKVRRFRVEEERHKAEAIRKLKRDRRSAPRDDSTR